MSTQTLDRPGPGATRLAARFHGEYLALTSYKRDGTGVATPVWFVADGERLLVLTDARSFKAKRISRNPAVTIALCAANGRLRSQPVTARAELLPAPSSPASSA